ncbi:MAG: ECF transporter S component [Defluviitaleaceae bacterium]|nr:ECF transporter S component [Defluviitaleaceae bacterium]
MSDRTKQLTAMAMLTAMAFILGAVLRLRGIFPMAPFLTFELKDVGILIGGFMFGPLAALLMSIVLALLEMITISESGILGAIMNALGSAAFTCTAAFIYNKKRGMKGAIVGLVAGSLVMTTVMILFNYVITPLYVPGVTREAVTLMILPALLPFNLIKAGVNSIVVLLIYKRVSVALKAAGFYKSLD